MGHRYPQKHSLGKILNVTLIMVILPEVENWELRVGLFSVHSSKFVQKAFIISGITFMKIKINFLNNYVQNVQSKKKKKLEQIYSLVQRSVINCFVGSSTGSAFPLKQTRWPSFTTH